MSIRRETIQTKATKHDVWFERYTAELTRHKREIKRIKQLLRDGDTGSAVPLTNRQLELYDD